ncbi:hypothetical protein AB4Z10_11030 [Bosea sp. RAF48]|uniref:hypothetical protein n=1 Tax=Bosea sp. RAF48 TaxID=3237480 RepID=UPI003F939034
MATAPQSYRIGAAPMFHVAPHHFPPAAEYIIYSKPIFTLQIGTQSEVLEFSAEMHVRCSDPQIGPDNNRQVAVEVVKWEARGRSGILGVEVTFASVRDKGSVVVAGSPAADLPGKMKLWIDSAIYVDGRKIEEHEGRAEGWGVSSFPPSEGDLFSLTKSPQRSHDLAVLTGGQVHGLLSVGAVACACSSSSLLFSAPSSTGSP